MKKSLIFIMFTLILSGCAIETKQISLQSLTNKIEAGEDFTFVFNYGIFNFNNFQYRNQLNDFIPLNKSNAECKSNYERLLITFETNCYKDGIFYYNCHAYPDGYKTGTDSYDYNLVLSSSGSSFKNKVDDKFAVYNINKNATSTNMSFGSYFNEDISGIKSTLNNIPESLIYFEVQYPVNQLTVPSSAKIGNKITITSDTPFFDETTFSTEKVRNLLDKGYFIVWIEGDLTKYPSPIYETVKNKNQDKLPVIKKYYDIESITPTRVSFTIPEYAQTGTVHVINEGGFVVHGQTTDIVGNVDDAYSYFASLKPLTITE